MMVNVDAENSYGALMRNTFVVWWNAKGNVANEENPQWGEGGTMELPERIN